MPHQRTFSCTSTHTSCYAPAHSLALPHIHHAMLLHVLSHFRAYTSCYAAVYSLALPDDVVPRCCTFSCISTHTYCYAAAQSLPLPHICHTTSQHSSLCWWLRSLKRGLQTTSARKRLKWQNVVHNRDKLVKHLKGNRQARVLLCQNTDFRQTVGFVKNTSPQQLHTHEDCRQGFQKKWKHLHAAIWHKRAKCNILNILGQLCAWKGKGNFAETLDEQNSSFVLVQH